MNDVVDVLSALRLSKKGRLKYDVNWDKDGGLEKLLSECTSPPEIYISPQAQLCNHSLHGLGSDEPAGQLNKSPLSCRPHTEGTVQVPLDRVHYKNLTNENNHKLRDKDEEEQQQQQQQQQQQLTGGITKQNVPPAVSLGASGPEVSSSGVSPAVSEMVSPRAPRGTFPAVASPEVTPRAPLVVSPRVSSEKAIREADSHLEHRAKLCYRERRRLFEDHSVALAQVAQNKLSYVSSIRERATTQVVEQVQKVDKAKSEEVRRTQLKLREHHKQHAKLLDEKMMAAHRKQAEEEEQEKKRQQEALQRLKAMMHLHQELVELQAVSSRVIKSCQYPQCISQEALLKTPAVIATYVKNVEQMISLCQQSEASQKEVDIVKGIQQRVKAQVTQLITECDAANRKGQGETDKKQQQQQQAAATPTTSVATVTTSPAASSPQVPGASNTTGTPPVKMPSLPGALANSIAVEALLEYERLQGQLKQVEHGYQALVADAGLKKMRFDLKKAINTPINAISPTSGSHLRDKLERLCKLLSGQPVEVGGKRVSVTSHPAGLLFCKDLLAKKLVQQGEEQVSSNHESAFAIAAVAVGVWCEFPDVGELMLAHFYIRCPYLVPYYIPKKEGQSREDYYKCLGYNYDNGELEKQDKFMRRMSGLMSLYAALMVTTPPRGRRHPHGTERAWQWLTRTINLQPRPDVTATTLHDFLQVTGQALLKGYGKQFIKLLQIVITDYMPKIKKVTPQGAGGPVTRLQSFLDGVLRTGQILRPQGQLPSNFWST